MHESWEIRRLSAENLPECAEIIRQSFASLMVEFGLLPKECPAHVGPSVDAVLAEKYSNSYYPFGFFEKGKQVGFVSITDRGGGVFEMNHLAVLPTHRHAGIGKMLVDHCKNKVCALGGSKIFIEVIEKNALVTKWYGKNDFHFIKYTKYEDFPLRLLYMEWESGEIRPVTLAQVPEIAEIIRKSFKTTAKEYNYTAEHYPTHQGPRIGELLAERFGADFHPYGYFLPKDTAVAFVSLINRGRGVFEMKFLSVVPEYRRFGIGQKLLDFCKNKVYERGGRKIIIDLIEENTVLREWYLRNGFIRTRIEVIENHPFTVGHMEWAAKNLKEDLS